MTVLPAYSIGCKRIILDGLGGRFDFHILSIKFSFTIFKVISFVVKESSTFFREFAACKYGSTPTIAPVIRVFKYSV